MLPRNCRRSSGELVCSMSISPVCERVDAGVGVDDRLVGDGVQVGVALAPVVRVPWWRSCGCWGPTPRRRRARCRWGSTSAVRVVEHGGRRDVRRSGPGPGSRGTAPTRLFMLMVTESGPVTEALRIWSAKAGPVRTEVADFSMLRWSALASSGVPSWKTMPGRRVMVKAVKSAFDVIDWARYGSHPSGGVHDRDGVEDGTAVEEAPLVPAGRGGVEAALLGVDAEGDGAAPLRLGARDPVPPGTVGLGRARLALQASEHGGAGAQCKSSGQERPAIKRLRHRNPPRSRSHVVPPCRGTTAAGYNFVTLRGWRPIAGRGGPYGNLGPDHPATGGGIEWRSQSATVCPT